MISKLLVEMIGEYGDKIYIDPTSVKVIEPHGHMTRVCYDGGFVIVKNSPEEAAMEISTALAYLNDHDIETIVGIVQKKETEPNSEGMN